MTLSAAKSTPLLPTARGALVLGTFAALGCFAWELVAIAFRLNARIGLRSLLGLALPLVGAGYWISARPRWLVGAPTAARFGASLAAGALTPASVSWFLPLLPIPGAELVIASCAALLAGALATDRERSTALFCGVALGMLAYVALRGIPQVVPG
jgi:hypothetical protein